MKYLKEDNDFYHFSNGGKVVKVAKKGVGKDFIKKYNQGGVVDLPKVTNPTKVTIKKKNPFDPSIELPTVRWPKTVDEGPQPVDDREKRSLGQKIKDDYDQSVNMIKGGMNGVRKLLEREEEMEGEGYYDGGMIQPARQPNSVDDLERFADQQGLDETDKRFLRSIYGQESNYGKNTATSSAGARGPMQIIPKTFNSLKKQGLISQQADINNLSDNKLAAVALYRQLKNDPRTKGDPRLIAAAYHAGPNDIVDGKINPSAKDTNGKYTTSYADDVVKRSQGYMPMDRTTGPDSKYPLSSYENEMNKPFYMRSADQGIDPRDPLQFNPNAPATFAEVGYPNDDYYMQQATQGGPMFESALGAIGLGRENSQEQFQYVSPQGVGFNRGQSNQSVPDYQLAAGRNQDAILKAQQYGGQGRQQMPQQETYGAENPYKMLQDVERGKSGALQTQAKVDENVRLAQEKFANKQIKQQQKFLEDRNRILDESNKQIDKYVNDYSKLNLDPFRSMRDASTSRMFTGAIGLMLSGIGSALTGQPSQALMVIDRAIDRDIEAQKFNIGKGKTILDMQLQKYGNEKDAIAATEIILGTQALAEMNKAIAIAKKPEIKANLEVNMANLKLAILEKQMLLRQAGIQTKLSGAGAVRTNTPEFFGAARADEKFHEKTFVDDRDVDQYGNARVYLIRGDKSADKVRQYMPNIDDLMKNLEEIQDFQDISSRLPWTDSYASGKATYESAIKNFMTNESAKVFSTRLSELEHEMARKIIPNPTAWSINIKKKSQELMKQLENERESFLRANLVGYTKRKGLHDIEKEAGFNGR